MKNQQEKKNQTQSSLSQNTRNWIIFYTDAVIRGLISFFFFGLIVYAFLKYYFNISPMYVFPIMFLVVIALSPLMSKIKLGEKILNKYEEFLDKKFSK